MFLARWSIWVIQVSQLQGWETSGPPAAELHLPSSFTMLAGVAGVGVLTTSGEQQVSYPSLLCPKLKRELWMTVQNFCSNFRWLMPFYDSICNPAQQGWETCGASHVIGSMAMARNCSIVIPGGLQDLYLCCTYILSTCASKLPVTSSCHASVWYSS